MLNKIGHKLKAFLFAKVNPKGTLFFVYAECPSAVENFN